MTEIKTVRVTGLFLSVGQVILYTVIWLFILFPLIAVGLAAATVLIAHLFGVDIDPFD